jgi:general secretion pathway protein G
MASCNNVLDSRKTPASAWRNRRSAIALSPAGRGLGLARSRRGFTFLEIMLVVVIIGILVAVVGPNLVGKTKKAKIGAVKQQIQNLKTALSTFEITAGRFPTTEEGLEALVQLPSGLDEEEWDGPYIDADVMPDDPWKQPYQYKQPGEKSRNYDLWSFGPDELDNTEDDIGNWVASKEK